MMILHFSLSSVQDTALLAAKLGHFLRLGDFVCLEGDLGAGKSTFARALIQHLNPAEEEVPSPTFTLLQSYDVPQGSLHHLDLYRLGSPEEIYEMGWEELRQGIMLVEWPERLGRLRPQHAITVALRHGQGEQERDATLTLPEGRVWEEQEHA